MKGKIIMMYGYPANGKTYLSKRLESGLSDYKTTRISSLEFRERMGLFDFKSEKQRNKVYDLVAEKVKSLIKSYQVIIIDGNFNKRERREKIYSISDDLLIIHCCVSNEEIIKKRMREREGIKNINENKASDLELYYLIKNSGDDIKDDEIIREKKVNYIRFNSEYNKIDESCLIDKSRFIKNIISIIEGISSGNDLPETKDS